MKSGGRRGGVEGFEDRRMNRKNVQDSAKRGDLEEEGRMDYFGTVMWKCVQKEEEKGVQ